MVEQNALAALAISDRGYVLELGKNALEGTGKDLLSDPEVGRLFLGRGK
jgi:ABC-type branched-subunit amino acid transport system ATPase component